jgi:S-methylmethionine-dependent homocysteine/selenocysteine methylase
MEFAERLKSEPVFLAEGAIGTRLIYEFKRETPDFAQFVHLFDPASRADMIEIFRSYMEIAAEYDLPMLVSAPTWRAHPEGLARQGFDAPGDLVRVNNDAVAMVQGLRRELGLEHNVYIAGVIGPRFDGYDPSGAPDAATAEAYHLPQARVLAAAGVDVLSARTFTSMGELLGIARAFAATGLPYVLAPVINADGHLRDGTPLDEAVARIDAEVSRPPLHFFIGCVHPAHVVAAADGMSWPISDRVHGLHGNASDLSHDQLDKLDHLDAGDSEDFADRMVELHGRGVKLLGGCCGTGVAHIRAVARRFAAG